MNLQDEICQAFCGGLTVRKVPAGLAIGTPYDGANGDPVGFFIIGPDKNGFFKIQDDGLSVPFLESQGADLGNKTRKEAFDALLNEYEASLDEETAEISSRNLKENEVATAAIKFAAFLLRLQDLIFMSQERAASTFRNDAMKIIRELANGRAEVYENYILSESLKEFPADVALIAPQKSPVAVFFGVSDMRVSEAMLLQAYAEKEGVACSVVALLEVENSVSKKTRQRAANHLDATPYFRDDERAACARIIRQATGYDPRVTIQ